MDRANSPRRFFMLLVMAFATLGLLLPALGIYGQRWAPSSCSRQRKAKRPCVGCSITGAQPSFET